MESEGTPGIVMCHLSHAYRDGASLYYTFIAPSKPGAEIEHWRAVKTAACEAIVAHEGTITHHHAVGRDHAPYMQAEVGEVGIEALRALKERARPGRDHEPRQAAAVVRLSPRDCLCRGSRVSPAAALAGRLLVFGGVDGRRWLADRTVSPGRFESCLDAAPPPRLASTSSTGRAGEISIATW